MPYRFFITILLFVFTLTAAWSQPFVYCHYDTEKGLAGNKVFSVFQQDSCGFLWFGTNNGLSRFDGRDFHNFSLNNCSGSNEVRAIAQINNDSLLVSCFNEGLYLLARHQCIPTATEQQFKSVVALKVNPTDGTTWGLGVQNRQRVLLSYRQGQLYSPNDFEGALNKPELRVHSLCISKGTWVFGTNHGLVAERDGQFKSITNTSSMGQINAVACCAAGALLFAKGYSIYQMDLATEKLEKVEELPSKIGKLLPSSHGGTWVLTDDNSVYFMADTFRLNLSDYLPISDLIKDILEDHEGNLWIATQGDGVYCINRFLEVRQSRQNQKPVNDIVQDESGHIWFAETGALYRTDANGENTLDFSDLLLPQEAADCVQDLPADTLLIGTDRRMLFISQSSGNLLHSLKTGVSGVVYLPEKQELIVGSHEKILVAKAPFKSYQEHPFIKAEGTVNDLHYDAESAVLWVACSKGLVEYDQTARKCRFYGIDEGLKSLYVSSITQDDQNRIWVATAAGVSSIQNSVVHNYVQMGVQPSSEFHSIALAQGVVWAGGVNGLYRLKGAGLASYPILLQSSPEITCIHPFDDGSLMLGTNKEWIHLSPEIYEGPAMGKTYILEVMTSGQSVTGSKNHALSYPASNISFDFTAVNFSDHLSPQFEYMLEGAGQQWLHTNNQQIDFSKLMPGSYTFRLRTLGSTEMASFGFAVVAPIWYQKWFLALLVLLVFAALLVLFFRRLRSIKRRNEAQRQLDQKMSHLRQQALNSMMNPHFLYNSLNSIDYRIKKDGIEAGQAHLRQFSQLLRMNLENAFEETVSLKEEVERLELYLVLEKGRLGEKLSFNIHTNGIKDAEEIILPIMVVQPFVENAVWHGISGNEKGGVVEVVFSELPQHRLGVQVFDNGPGFELKVSKGGKRGIALVWERLVLYDPDALLTISKYQHPRLGKGTLVDMIIPV